MKAHAEGFCLILHHRGDNVNHILILGEAGRCVIIRLIDEDMTDSRAEFYALYPSSRRCTTNRGI